MSLRAFPFLAQGFGDAFQRAALISITSRLHRRSLPTPQQPQGFPSSVGWQVEGREKGKREASSSAWLTTVPPERGVWLRQAEAGDQQSHPNDASLCPSCASQALSLFSQRSFFSAEADEFVRSERG